MISIRLLVVFLGIATALCCRAEDDFAYRLQAFDQIGVTVYQEEDLTTETTLTKTGEASFKFIGSINLSGLTLGQAKEAITEAYLDGWLVSPEVTVTLIKARQERVTVIGAVNAPGEIEIPQDSPLDLVTAIAGAGGLAKFADGDGIRLNRNDLTTTYSFGKLQEPGAGQILLQNGDRIDVPMNRFANTSVTIVGEIENADTFPFPLSGRLDLGTLIGKAGGLSEAADLKRATIKRGTKLMRINTGGTTLLAPGDVVTIPASLYVGKSVTVVGEVNRPGPIAFSLDGRMSILNAIGRAGGYKRLGNEEKVKITRTTKEGKQTYTLNLRKMADGEVPLFYLSPGDVISVPTRRI
ncbi:MAG: polysaccharide biosynthesis/export family protein [Verrucomicrobiaceae bacterium]